MGGGDGGSISLLSVVAAGKAIRTPSSNVPLLKGKSPIVMGIGMSNSFVVPSNLVFTCVCVWKGVVNTEKTKYEKHQSQNIGNLILYLHFVVNVYNVLMLYER